MGFNGFEWDLVKFFMGLFIGTAWGLGLVFLDFMGLSQSSWLEYSWVVETNIMGGARLVHNIMAE